MCWVLGATPWTLYFRGKHGTQCIGGWVGSRASLDGGRKISPPPGFDPRTVQPIASRYTDWAALAHNYEALDIKYYVCVCLYSCVSDPACESHLCYAEFYRQLRHVWFFRIFPRFVINGTIFGKNNLLNRKCVFILSTNLSQKLQILWIIQRGIIINVKRYSGKVPFIRDRF
jgi:hypothetical protein